MSQAAQNPNGEELSAEKDPKNSISLIDPVITPPEVDHEKVVEMEKRLRVLESAVIRNAAELRDRVVERLDKIEERVQFEVEELQYHVESGVPDYVDEPIESNVVVFPETMKMENDRLPQRDAVSSLNEFTDTLTVTRRHLEALTQSISKMRVELSS